MEMARSHTNEREASRNRRYARGDSEPADWGAVADELIAGAVVAATSQSWAIRFGYTRDGGAYTIGILGDGEPQTIYIRPTEGIEQWLAGFIEEVRNI